MSVNLTCNQVSALMSFYLEDRLNNQLRQFVEAHLELCPMCKAKYEALKGLVNSLKEVHEKLTTEETPTDDYKNDEQYNNFKENLSAYVDNELNDEENIKVKKYIISNQKARAQVENMYSIKKLLNDSFEKTKSEVKDDCAKFVLKRIDIQEEVYGSDSFGPIVAVFVIILTIFSLGAALVFWA